MEDGYVGEIESSVDLVTAINDEHRRCDEAVSTALDHAMRAGDLLIEARADIGHGNWQAWIEENFEGSLRRAQEYMRLAKNRESIEAEKARSSALLGIDRALRAIAAPKQKNSSDASEAAEPLDERIIAVRQEIVRDGEKPDEEIAAELQVEVEKVAKQRRDIEWFGPESQDYAYLPPQERPPEASIKRWKPSGAKIKGSLERLSAETGLERNHEAPPPIAVAETLLEHIEAQAPEGDISRAAETINSEVRKVRGQADWFSQFARVLEDRAEERREALGKRAEGVAREQARDPRISEEVA
jgi:hypothetical protein